MSSSGVGDGVFAGGVISFCGSTRGSRSTVVSTIRLLSAVVPIDDVLDAAAAAMNEGQPLRYRKKSAGGVLGADRDPSPACGGAWRWPTGTSSRSGTRRPAAGGERPPRGRGHHEQTVGLGHRIACPPAMNLRPLVSGEPERRTKLLLSLSLSPYGACSQCRRRKALLCTAFRYGPGRDRTCDLG